jgi:hypothetical protein
MQVTISFLRVADINKKVIIQCSVFTANLYAENYIM